MATVLQVPLSAVPDWRLDERRDAGESVAAIDRSAKLEFGQWLTGRGLVMVAHSSLPVNHPRWIGVCARPGTFTGHALVMCRSAVLWDPGIDWQRRSLLATGGGTFTTCLAQRQRRVKFFGAADVTHGYSFRSTR